MKKEFSLVMATYGRDLEVKNFFVSLLKSDYDISKVEVILVDQNTEIDLSKYVDLYKSEVSIKYIKSIEMGLSVNRNKGIKEATGKYIAFPDDDCEYLENTLSIVSRLFLESNADCIMGRIVERDGSDSLRKWSKENMIIDKFNFYTRCSSITMFYNRLNSRIKFNDMIGAGKYFGACEDTDLLYKNLKCKKNIIYRSELMVYHPHYNPRCNMSREKINSYGLGFGAFVKSNFDFHIGFLCMKVECYHILKAIGYLIMLKTSDSKNSIEAFKSRVKGFLEYKN